MDAVAIGLMVLVGLAILVGIAFFGFVAWFIFTTARRVLKGQREFDRNWNEGPFANRHNR